jgi:hypothetical protein
MMMIIVNLNHHGESCSVRLFTMSMRFVYECVVRVMFWNIIYKAYQWFNMVLSVIVVEYKVQGFGVTQKC